MAKTTLKTGATGNSEAAYVKFVENIVVKLTENIALFPDVEPERDVLEQLLSEFKRTQADAAYRDKRMVVIKNQAYATLKAEVYRMSLYVERQAAGDEAMILAAGFIPSKRGMRVLEPAPKPKIFIVEVNAQISGVADLKVNGWRRVLAYRFEYRKKNSDSHWNPVLSSKSKVTIIGLEPVQEYEFRVAYIGRNPQITYSDIVSSYVF
ncbi:fibronectin type III domain-containing protein [Sphingobacterium sp. DN00404]|uniref:Fibronectin type III domain-containing protein n=1 Tax=Sphingobacterium micropteri TaxID=2763501 RepID=A0ABR7YSH3_9SPHI|nr:fibronectin type III domain-containing protein [Sphingobacterium micropteri]MBD1434232.1 fibronectin type III domain-containing protein [Sphingobacterium micropteri]